MVPVSDQLPPVPDQPKERRPSTLGGLVYLVVLAATVVGLAVVAFGPWRRGIGLIGVAMLVAAVSRFALGEGNAGMLRIGRRWFDVLFFLGAGVLLIVLAGVIPNQPA